MAEKRDFYEVLGLQKGATADEIKKAYRRLAKENHPDLHPDDKECEARFKEINEAYEVLSDPDKKAKYDQFGYAGVDPNFAATGGGGGSSRARSGPQRGESLRVSLSISFEEAAFGCSKEINITKVEQCETCHGTGCADGESPETCPDCRGSGTVRQQQRTPFGVVSSTTTCPKCGGTGKIITKPCSSCHGSGTKRVQRKISVNIPAGIADGQSVSLRGQGNAGRNGGPSGDLLVAIRVQPSDIFEREGDDILYEMPISFTQAALGAEVEVPTLDGKVKYSIHEGTQTGSVFRLRGKGVQHLRGSGRGDQYVTVNVEVPKNLTSAQKDALRKFAETMGEGGSTDSQSSSGTTGFGKRKKKK
jgi:molecular chaperone DnaJ